MGRYWMMVAQRDLIKHLGTSESPENGPDVDAAKRFTRWPTVNQLPSLQSYGWAAQLRRFAYAASRRARGADLVRTPSASPALQG